MACLIGSSDSEFPWKEIFLCTPSYHPQTNTEYFLSLWLETTSGSLLPAEWREWVIYHRPS